MPNNQLVANTKPLMGGVFNTKPTMGGALNVKSDNISVSTPTQVYTQTQILLAGMPIPFGGAFHLTYPQDVTVTFTRP